MATTVQKALTDAMVALFSTSDSPEIDSEVLLSHCIGQSRAWLLAYQDEELDNQQEIAYQDLVEQRAAGKPIAYILGEKEFWSLSLKVNEHTLIPRPDTEILVEVALELAAEYNNQEQSHILDLGTGSGAIALALASELPKSQICAIDQSVEALNVASDNAEHLKISNVNFKQSHWFSNIEPQPFDLICSNPPYIEQNDHHLSQGDVRFEPITALTSGVDGLRDIHMIAEQSKNYLKDTAWLVIEHGYNQHKRVQSILQENGYSNVQTRNDYGDNPRVTYGQWLS